MPVTRSCTSWRVGQGYRSNGSRCLCARTASRCCIFVSGPNGIISTSQRWKSRGRAVAHFHPQQVLLCGSHAYGTPTPDSEVDLLVVMETPLRHVEQAVEIRQAVHFPFPVDLLVRTPQHIAERLALGDAFLREVLSKGVVLYAANDTGMGRSSRRRCQCCGRFMADPVPVPLPPGRTPHAAGRVPYEPVRSSAGTSAWRVPRRLEER
jgi:hypothetical protein